jgi:hypothetical protein
VWPRFEIFLKDVLSAADGLKHQLLIGHDVISGQSANGPHRIMSWPGAIRSIGFCNSVIRWELVELLRRVSMPVWRGDRNVTTAILG